MTYIVPSVYVAPRQISIQTLDLSRNQLDCGDCELISDVLGNQESLRSMNLSFNRIGCRGLMILCEALNSHREIAVLDIGHNRYCIGCSC